MKKDKRLLFLNWLNRKVFNTKEGCISPKFVRVCYYILYPLNWAYEKQSGIRYDIMYDVYHINGKKFTGQFFSMLSNEANNKTRVELTIENDAITMKPINGTDLERVLERQLNKNGYVVN